MLSLPRSRRSESGVPIAVRTSLLVLALFATPLAPDLSAQSVARYRLTIDNTWSEATHPGLVPPDAHFSWLGGGVHHEAISFWKEGELASPGMKMLAESGATHDLTSEFYAYGSAYAIPKFWWWWFCPDAITNTQCGKKVLEFDIPESHPRATFVTMLGPSPDWFVGTNALPLHDGTGWVDEIVVDLYPYDAGTRSNNALVLYGPETIPPEPIHKITAQTGQIITPASLGTFTFKKIGQIYDLGQGLAGHFNPRLQVTGSLLPGEEVNLSFSDLPPAKPAGLFIGLNQQNLPFMGGTLVPDPLISLILTTGPGAFEFNSVMPPGLPSASQVVLQMWVADPGGPSGASATNAVGLVMP